MHFLPVQPKLVAFTTLDGVGLCYGQLYRNVSNDAYKVADIDRFLPHNGSCGYTQTQIPWKY